MIMALVMNSRFYTKGSAELIGDAIDEINIDDYDDEIDIIKDLMVTLSSNEFYPSKNRAVSQKDDGRAYDIVKDIYIMLMKLRKLYPQWD
jgi:hypothetical protein